MSNILGERYQALQTTTRNMASYIKQKFIKVLTAKVLFMEGCLALQIHS